MAVEQPDLGLDRRQQLREQSAALRANSHTLIEIAESLCVETAELVWCAWQEQRRRQLWR